MLDETGAQRVRTLLGEGKPLDEAILAADGVGEDKMLRLLGQVFDVPYVDLEPLTLSQPWLPRYGNDARLLSVVGAVLLPADFLVLSAPRTQSCAD